MSRVSAQAFHDLYGTLNGVGLQLEVIDLAFGRGDEAMHARALAAAREAVLALERQIQALREELGG